MSEENAPKLRLKPRLSGDAPAANSSPSTPANQEPPVAETATPAPAPVRLKPRLTLAASEPAPANPTPTEAVSSVSAADQTVASSPIPAPVVPPPASEPVPVPPPAANGETATSRPKIALKPREPIANPAPEPAPTPAPVEVDAPPPVAATTDEPPVLAPPPVASFPPPPGVAKFPPPPGLKKPGTPSEPPTEPLDEQALKAAATEKKPRRTVLMLAGGGAAVLAIAGAALWFFVLREPPPPPIQPRPVVQGKTTAKPAEATPAEQKSPAAPAASNGYVQAVAKTKQVSTTVANGQTAAANDVLAADAPALAKPGSHVVAQPASNGDASETTAAASSGGAALPPSVERAAGVPAPSFAFKAWVQNLRISGVRGGASPRVFIERTAYAPGELVNPMLGITFEGYNTETRMLVFKDKTGATVERRN